MADNKSMNELFDKLAEVLLSRLKDKSCSSADLNTVRQFLRDNGITSTSKENPALKELTDNLPYDEDGDGEQARH